MKEETESGEGTWAVSAVPRVPAVPTEMSSAPPGCSSPVMASVLSIKMLSVTPALSSIDPSPTATAGNAMANDMLQMENKKKMRSNRLWGDQEKKKRPVAVRHHRGSGDI